MPASVAIIAIDFDPPGRDLAGEHVLLQNLSTEPVDLTRWTLRDIAPVRPHVFTFPSLTLPPDGQVRVWTKSGTADPANLFWKRKAAVWNNPGDTAILRDADGTEVGRFTYGDPPQPSQGWRRRSPATSPPARSGACMVYDAVRGNVVLFGGGSRATGFADTWTWDGSNWTERTPSESPPFALHGHMAFDRARGVAVLWGGIGHGGAYPIDTWTWDGTNWTKHSPPTSPPGRDSGMMEWDGSNIVLYGGATNNARRADMWAWDGQTWAQVEVSAAPGVRVGAVMTFDETAARVVLHGGSSDTTTLNDTWTWDGHAWAQQQPAPNPGNRIGAASAWDGSRVLVFGGVESALVPALDGLWAWDGSGWSRLPETGPAARPLSLMARDASGQGVVLFCGEDIVNAADPGDTWTYRTT